ncbi:hypothetical protein [Roseibium aggregatum]|nr:hypothetical protein [Roseibium aggregatum]
MPEFNDPVSGRKQNDPNCEVRIIQIADKPHVVIPASVPRSGVA